MSLLHSVPALPIFLSYTFFFFSYSLSIFSFFGRTSSSVYLRRFGQLTSSHHLIIDLCKLVSYVFYFLSISLRLLLMSYAAHFSVISLFNRIMDEWDSLSSYVTFLFPLSVQTPVSARAVLHGILLEAINCLNWIGLPGFSQPQKDFRQ